MPSSYSSPVVATINLDGLAAGTVAVSTAIDNTSTMYDSAQVILTLKPGPVRAGGYVVVGLQGSVDNNTFTDSSVPLLRIKSEDGNLVNGQSHQYLLTLNNLPQYFKIFVHNRTGSAFSAVSGDNALSYVGVKN